jgi:hypothetical protein
MFERIKVMDPPVRIGVIVNPYSKKNRKKKNRSAQLQEIVGKFGVVIETRDISELHDAVRKLLELNVKYWVSDGGDGALHWLLNKTRDILQEGETFSPDNPLHPSNLPCAIPTNGGTINFVTKKVGIRGKAEDILQGLVRAYTHGAKIEEVEVPSFYLEGTLLRDGREQLFTRIGFAAAIAGVGQTFFDKYYLDRVPGPHTIIKVIVKALGSLILNHIALGNVPMIPASWRRYSRDLFRKARARIKVDGEELPYRKYNAIHIGAFNLNLGGLIRLFNFAGGGKLHVQAGDIPPWVVVRNLPNLFLGRRVESNGLFDGPGKFISIYTNPGEVLNPVVDGEIIRGVKVVHVAPGPKIKIPKVEGTS